MAGNGIFEGIDHEIKYGVRQMVPNERLENDQRYEEYLKRSMARDLADVILKHLELQKEKDEEVTTYRQDFYLLTWEDMRKVVRNIRSQYEEEIDNLKIAVEALTEKANRA